MNKSLEKAIEILRSGGIVIFPTDTTFVIGCRVDDEKTVRRLFEVRKRPKEKAISILASSIEMVEEYVGAFGSDVRKLMRRYWPGGLTLALPANLEKVPSLVRGGGKTIGVRIPNHSTIRKIIKDVGVPILGPSANFAGEKTPFKMSELDQELVRKVDFVLPGRCKIKTQSTVLDVTVRPWRVIRAGAVEI